MSALPREYHVPRSVLRKTSHFLRQQGRAFKEGVVLWAVRKDEPSLITRAIVPEQEAMASPFGGCVIVPLDYRERLSLAMYGAGEYCAVQVHSHPREAFHSIVDDHYPAIHHRGAYSIVVPNFARDPFSDFDDVAVYRLMHWPEWHKLTLDERRQTFHVVE